MASTEDLRLSDWIRQPASWLSIAAVLVSVFTFYFVYFNPGKLIVPPAPEAGLYLRGDSLMSLFLPITFSNTSAPRVFRHVKAITATLSDDGEGANGAKSYTFQWRFERRFVDRLAYERQDTTYHQGGVDVLIYERRAFPFSIPGGESVGKVLELWSYDLRPSWNLRQFRLVLHVHTLDGDKSVTSKYSCHGPVTTDLINYCFLEV